MRFYHYWNVKSRSPCFSEVAEFPCPVAFLTACWEGVFGYSRRPSRGFGRMQFCWSSSFVCLQIEPNNPCGDEWNPLSLPPGTDALFPLRTTVHWLQNYVECAIMEMPVQHGPDILTTAKLIPLTQCFLINRGTKKYETWYLKSTLTGTKEARFVISAPLMSSTPP